MIIDSSALVAILLGEPERAAMVSLIADAGRKLVSTGTILETAMVLESRLGPPAGDKLDRFLSEAGVRIIAFDEAQLALARLAFQRFGRGRHKAALNFGDCIVYALARLMGEAILCKGSDFALTDARTIFL